jgi:hypothetical protein
VCDCSFKIIIDSFIQNGLNMMVLYVSGLQKSMCVTTFACLSNAVSRGKNSLLSDDLLQRIDDTMFDNPFVN